MVIVTNLVGSFESGKIKKGFYMDGYLVTNLLGIKDYLKKDWDCVGIISGHGKVRVGKSTIGFQVGSFIAWLLAGGRMKMEKSNEGKWIITDVQNPKKLNWNLKENVVFSATELQKQSYYLYKKYGKNQVLVYDEGRQGLEAKRAMENLNKIMEDFLQECGYMGHVILIVLPNFFKLHEDYAVSRSLFLIDAFTNIKKHRGFFNFYDENQKEWLYFLGKKKLGISHKYTSACESFWGRFSSWFPFDREEYNRLKGESIKKKYRSRRQMNWKKQRDVLIYLHKQETEKTNAQIAEDITVLSGFRISTETIDKVIQSLTKKEYIA